MKSGPIVTGKYIILKPKKREKKEKKKSFQGNTTKLAILHIIEKWLKKSLFPHVK